MMHRMKWLRKAAAVVASDGVAKDAHRRSLAWCRGRARRSLFRRFRGERARPDGCRRRAARMGTPEHRLDRGGYDRCSFAYRQHRGARTVVTETTAVASDPASARAALLTGVLPAVLGVDESTGRLAAPPPEGVTVLPEQLRRAGYYTSRAGPPRHNLASYHDVSVEVVHVDGGVHAAARARPVPVADLAQSGLLGAWDAARPEADWRGREKDWESPCTVSFGCGGARSPGRPCVLCAVQRRGRQRRRGRGPRWPRRAYPGGARSRRPAAGHGRVPRRRERSDADRRCPLARAPCRRLRAGRCGQPPGSRPDRPGAGGGVAAGVHGGTFAGRPERKCPVGAICPGSVRETRGGQGSRGRRVGDGQGSGRRHPGRLPDRRPFSRSPRVSICRAPPKDPRSSTRPSGKRRSTGGSTTARSGCASGRSGSSAGASAIATATSSRMTSTSSEVE